MPAAIKIAAGVLASDFSLLTKNWLNDSAVLGSSGDRSARVELQGVCAFLSDDSGRPHQWERTKVKVMSLPSPSCVAGWAAVVWLAANLIWLNVAAQVLITFLVPLMIGFLVAVVKALPEPYRLRGWYLASLAGVGALCFRGRRVWGRSGADVRSAACAWRPKTG